MGPRAGTVSAMSATHAPPILRGGGRVLTLSTVVMAVPAAGVLAVGIQDAHLLRLGLVAALWAALLGAFAAAQMRREVRYSADHADQLRSTYQLELEREVTARREHTLTVERQLREQAELCQRREIVELRAEIAAMRARLELLGGGSLVERVTLRAESTRLVPLPAQPRSVTGSRVAAQAIPADSGRTDSGFCPGPGRPATSATASALPPANTGISAGQIPNSQGRHGVPDHNGAPRNGSRAVHTPEYRPSGAPAVQVQRTVHDLIAAHGPASASRRRRNHQDGTANTA